MIFVKELGINPWREGGEEKIPFLSFCLTSIYQKMTKGDQLLRVL